jgi:hypothetical protein
VESANRFLYHASYSRINFKHRISTGTRCGRDREPISKRIREMVILGQFINYLQQLILLQNKIVNWYTGGLNHQIEHHIFPNISHIHYGNIAKIVKETAEEFTVLRIQNNAKCVMLTSNI